MATQAGDGVDDEQRVSGVDEVGEAFEGLMRAGTGFGVDDADQFDVRMGVERGGDLGGFEGFAPGGFHGVDRGAAAFHDVLHAHAEDAIDADEDFVPGFDEVDRHAFHAGHAGAADGKGEGIRGAQDLPQHVAGRVHDREILRIKMSQGRRGEGAQDAL